MLPNKKGETNILTVAAYCRVSTDKDDQIHSFESQKRYFTEQVLEHPDWKLYKIFADEGISGTQIKHREAFQEMISAAKNKSFDLILTKEVSRFARNTVDTLEQTRMLKSLGVGVFFINDNINTLDNDGELRLTIMASLAQDESRRISQRVRWGMTQRAKRGIVYGEPYGYNLINGNLVVNPNESKVVKEIFNCFVYKGMTAQEIARLLISNCVPPGKRMKCWSGNCIIRILKNERYVGNLITNKFYISDYLTHKLVKNQGELEQYTFENHHEAIIDQETWNLAQIKFNSLNIYSHKKASNKYWFSNKIICSKCGMKYSVKKRSKKDSPVTSVVCLNKLKNGIEKVNSAGEKIGCSSKQLRVEIISAVAKYVICYLLSENNNVINKVFDIVKESLKSSNFQQKINNLKNEIESLKQNRVKVIEAYTQGLITADELTDTKNALNEQLDLKQSKLKELNIKKDSNNIANRLDSIQQRLSKIREGDIDEIAMGQLIENIIIYDEFISVKLYDVPVFYNVKFATKGRGVNFEVECLNLVMDFKHDFEEESP